MSYEEGLDDGSVPTPLGVFDPASSIVKAR
ncbi:hypothetical protein JOD45_001245 [Scopulibacillus daqui]|uniref:Uncharacterized protein n=1 Tax=Scopulibacillus daqui TaxID=1469162 RepID=A0ABS2PYT9_9BACL|nr:hypothetical protein [Scopulibacillus daqui]